MSLNLDARQRAMLAEMGVRVWLPEPVPATPDRSAVVPETIANKHDLTLGNGGKGQESTPRDRQPGAGEAVVTRAPVAPGTARAPQPAGIDGMDWTALRDTVAGCQACGLCQGRTQTVFGVGDTAAEWMVVGEAPGEQEDLQGEPFVGPSGQLLDNMLKAIGLSRHADASGEGANGGSALRGVYIANVVKCRPPGNRNPHPDEVAKCDPYLARQVALVRPKIILAMGRFAVQSLLQTTEPIGKLRGQVHRYHGVPVIVTYHPAYLLRNLPEKAKAWADLCLAMDVAERGG
ncbi:uracil-DNA glycosylase [Candidatus Skiveiella danica]|uniref:uracil-DNA glycosylase n=1 Tax=Candidatus Skiveiella danica TaxID=3386177 RepID=UPI001DACA7CB|nr:uracil-DNA glycosylase [Betaproteobacteria bacterium]